MQENKTQMKRKREKKNTKFRPKNKSRTFEFVIGSINVRGAFTWQNNWVLRRHEAKATTNTPKTNRNTTSDANILLTHPIRLQAFGCAVIIMMANSIICRWAMRLLFEHHDVYIRSKWCCTHHTPFSIGYYWFMRLFIKLLFCWKFKRYRVSNAIRIIYSSDRAPLSLSVLASTQMAGGRCEAAPFYPHFYPIIFLNFHYPHFSPARPSNTTFSIRGVMCVAFRYSRTKQCQQIENALRVYYVWGEYEHKRARSSFARSNHIGNPSSIRALC